MKQPLTDRQAALYEFIVSTIENEGRQPSYMEMCAFLGSTSRAGPSNHIDRLEAKGWLRRTPRDKRSLEIVGVKFERIDVQA